MKDNRRGNDICPKIKNGYANEKPVEWAQGRMMLVEMWVPSLKLDISSFSSRFTGFPLIRLF